MIIGSRLHLFNFLFTFLLIILGNESLGKWIRSSYLKDFTNKLPNVHKKARRSWLSFPRLMPGSGSQEVDGVRKEKERLTAAGFNHLTKSNFWIFSLFSLKLDFVLLIKEMENAFISEFAADDGFTFHLINSWKRSRKQIHLWNDHSISFCFEFKSNIPVIIL